MIERARDRAAREINRRRLLAERERDLRVAAVRERHPELARLEDEIRKEILSELGKAVSASDYSFSALDAKVAERNILLKELGIPRDYDRPRYTCSLCNDEGETGGLICRCRQELEVRLMPALFDVTLDSDQTFSNFNPHVFRSEKRADEPRSPREHMLDLLKVASVYTEHFFQLSDRDLYFY
jgi:hypothetical protein